MKKKSRSDYTPKPEKDRRRNQALRVVEILQVHRATAGREISVEEARAIAKRINRSERTVYRHLATLKLVYETIGTSLLDG